VLGHTQCGAVKGACDGVEMGHLTKTLALLAPAVEASKKVVPGPHDASNAAFVKHVTEENVRLTAARLLAESEILAELAKEGRLKIAPAVYEVETGRVRFLE
jgi:carbonic anhydrase